MGNTNRPEFFSRQDGGKAKLPFSSSEYERRLAALRAAMATTDIDAVLFTSMHNIAYYSGFLYCSFGRPYGCVITQDKYEGLEPEFHFAAGNPGSMIVGEAKEAEIDLIVLGRRGLGQFTGLLVGSTTTRVSQLAECAVLTVK